MLNKDNDYMMKLYKKGVEFEEKHDALAAKKLELVMEHGYGSIQLEQWYKEKNELVWPFKDGEYKAYRAWQNCVEREDDELVMDDFLWEKEVGDFLATLWAAGFRSFVYTNSSTSSMENIRAFIEWSCTLEPCTIIRKASRFGADDREEVFGLRFRLPINC